MKIRDISNFIEIPNTEEIDVDRNLTPTLCGNADDGSVLFINKRVSEGYSITPEEIIGNPYVIICDREYAKGLVGRKVMISGNTRAAYAHACYFHFGISNTRLRIIGVTGTNGKTTTATLIYHILNHAGIKCGMIGTGKILCGERSMEKEHYSMTTPDPEILYPTLAAMQSEGCDAVVMEVSSHSLALQKLSPLRFERGIFTNLSHEHMDFHKNQEDYFKAKLLLFDMCDGGIFNIDDEYSRRAYNDLRIPKSSVGIINKGDSYATDIIYHDASGSEFLYREKGLITRVKSNLPGAFNIYNTLLAMRCAIEMGVTPKCAKDAIADIEAVEGRMETVHHSPNVIIDYAHTPFAMENVIKSLKSLNNKGQRLIVVFGCGGCRDKEKRPIMGNLASIYADKIFITEDNSRDEDRSLIIEDIVSGIRKNACYTVIPDRKDAILEALKDAREYDTVLILGKGHEKYIIDKFGTHPFDERRIVSDFFTGKENPNEN